MVYQHLLTLTIFFPILGVLALFFVNRENAQALKVVGFLTTVVTFGVSLFLYFGYDSAAGGFQFREYAVWIAGLNISYYIGIDGISLLLIVLTTFLTPLALLGTWNSIQKRLREYTMMILLLEVGMIGVFASLDLFLFYIFWEAMLIPMYFIIGIWGGQDRVYAAIKFFLFTLFGSLLMLVAIIALGVYASTLPGGYFTTNLVQLYGVAPRMALTLQTWMFLAFTLSFAIKVPLFPFHTWLPDAHVQAPTAGSVLLAGVLLKMGTYGLIRFCLPLFPHAAFKFVPLLGVLSVIGIVYGALVAMVQTDLKKLVAYSSVSHLGFVVLGIFAMTEEGMQGAVIQMINHGLSTGALFLIVGMLYDRAHTRMIADFGGVAKVMPVFSTIFMIVSLSSIGLPGLNGFVGEFLILLGSFKSTFLGSHAYAIFASSGVILAAVYLLWAYQRVIFGKVREGGLYGGHHLTDLNAKEVVSLVALLVFIVWIGVYPGTFLSKSAPAAKQLVYGLESVRAGGLIRTAEIPAVTRPAGQ
ncbi:MAG: NADH-quinone oxidoreductase subunit M [Ignavibacteriales bacterium]|nr:NADH-quinone oxidoreductase subunit M [Ignavibacteriales bacterium]